jgi:hypothetical protein
MDRTFPDRRARDDMTTPCDLLILGSASTYPTMAEALKIGALAFSRDAAKLSCCAE